MDAYAADVDVETATVAYDVIEVKHPEWDARFQRANKVVREHRRRKARREQVVVPDLGTEATDGRDVARRVADAYDTAPGRDPPSFDPPWRGSATGTSCFVDRDKWYDLDGGGALRPAARASGIIGKGNHYAVKTIETP